MQFKLTTHVGENLQFSNSATNLKITPKIVLVAERPANLSLYQTTFYANIYAKTITTTQVRVCDNAGALASLRPILATKEDEEV